MLGTEILSAHRAFFYLFFQDKGGGGGEGGGTPGPLP